MLQRKGVVLAFAVLLVLIGSNIVFSQEQDTQAQPAAAPAVAPAVAETQWVWGEIVSVDAAKGEFIVRYLDYETDQEKEMAVSADDKTVYENAQSLADLKPQDTVSIDYVVGAENKNVAKNISLEKAEVAADSAQAPDAVKPEVVTEAAVTEATAAPAAQ